MPPRLNFSCAKRSLAIRARPSIAPYQSRFQPIASRRGFAEEKGPQPATGPNQDVLGHVSEEAIDTGNVTGETKPDLSQGTSVKEILERDGELDKAPDVVRKESNDKSAADTTSFENLLALGQIQNISSGGHGTDPVEFGNKFGLPELPLPSTSNLKFRYDPVVSQITNLLMRDGKKSVAQRNMSFILNHLRTAPPPTTNPTRPLLPGSPPASHLPLDPVQYLTVAIDSVAPLVRIRQLKGAAGGGASLQIPVPLAVRQRRRQAFTWILDAVRKKDSRGSVRGRGTFAQRVADELIGCVEGRSKAWESRATVHKAGTSARANLSYQKGGFSRRM